ncbi:unnamed protein product, partial [Rhizoctonia solani]
MTMLHPISVIHGQWWPPPKSGHRRRVPSSHHALNRVCSHRAPSRQGTSLAWMDHLFVKVYIATHGRGSIAAQSSPFAKVQAPDNPRLRLPAISASGMSNRASASARTTSSAASSTCGLGTASMVTRGAFGVAGIAGLVGAALLEMWHAVIGNFFECACGVSDCFSLNVVYLFSLGRAGFAGCMM